MAIFNDKSILLGETFLFRWWGLNSGLAFARQVLTHMTHIPSLGFLFWTSMFVSQQSLKSEIESKHLQVDQKIKMQATHPFIYQCPDMHSEKPHFIIGQKFVLQLGM
jgi:hypothetical protein